MKCPNCHHVFTLASTKRAKPIISDSAIDTSAMNDDQLRAHYKRTSHIDDVRFFIQAALVAGPTDLLASAIALLDAAKRGLPKAETLRRLCEIQDRWRELETRQGE